MFEIQNEETIKFSSSELLKILKDILVSEKEEITSTRFDKYYTSHKLGRLLTRMGIRKKREGKEGKRTYFINKEELKQFKIKFGMADISDIILEHKPKEFEKTFQKPQ